MEEDKEITRIQDYPGIRITARCLGLEGQPLPKVTQLDDSWEPMFTDPILRGLSVSITSSRGFREFLLDHPSIQQLQVWIDDDLAFNVDRQSSESLLRVGQLGTELPRPMLPFNLEEALAGKPVVTQNGWEVTNLQRHPDGLDFIVGVVNGLLACWTCKGKLDEPGDNTGSLLGLSLDLFMKPEPPNRDSANSEVAPTKQDPPRKIRRTALTPEQQIELIQAMVQGEKLQYQDKLGSDEWKPCGSPLDFNFADRNYRVAPTSGVHWATGEVILYALASCVGTDLVVHRSTAQPNVKFIFDGDTNKLKSVEVI